MSQEKNEDNDRKLARKRFNWVYYGTWAVIYSGSLLIGIGSDAYYNNGTMPILMAILDTIVVHVLGLTVLLLMHFGYLALMKFLRKKGHLSSNWYYSLLMIGFAANSLLLAFLLLVIIASAGIYYCGI